MSGNGSTGPRTAEQVAEIAAATIEWLNTARPDEITALDMIAVSRKFTSGLRIEIRRDAWYLTRGDLLRRTDADAWIVRDGKKVQLTLAAADEIAGDLNAIRPWER